MSLSKTSNFFKDIRTIWLAMITIGSSIIAMMTWAGDNRYMLKDDGVKIVDSLEIHQLSQRNEELTIMKIYETDPQKIKMIEALIENNKIKIQAILDERTITE